MMNRVTVSVVSRNDAVKEVHNAALASVLVQVDGVQSGQPAEGDLYGRVSGLEVLASFFGSAAFAHLVLAVRDYARRNTVEVEIERPDGSRLTVTGSGSDAQWIASATAFLGQPGDDE
jgi:hypothetical protein